MWFYSMRRVRWWRSYIAIIQCLIRTIGRDATRDFEDVGHSPDATAQIEQFVIGVVRQPTPQELHTSKTSSKSPERKKASSATLSDASKWISDNSTCIKQIAAASAAVVVAVFIARRYVLPGIQGARP